MRTCKRCEFFDGGGMGPDDLPRERHGDCHNRLSPRFETTGDNTCPYFVPSSTQWLGLKAGRPA